MKCIHLFIHLLILLLFTYYIPQQDEKNRFLFSITLDPSQEKMIATYQNLAKVYADRDYS